jgi:protein-disulfide isomerase
MDRRFVALLLVIIVGFAGFLLFRKDSTTLNSAVSNHTVNGSAAIKLVEYGDFQCPACGGFHPIVEQLREKYGDKLSFTFRHFPIDSIHPHARAASRAAEAAGNQGKFFEMYNLLYQNQSSWSGSNAASSTFEGYAAQLGIDVARFKSDVTSDSVNGTINADIEEGKDKGITGTPAFLLNGKELANTDINTIDGFSKVIDAALQASATPQTSAETSTAPSSN